jgi:hypothetical protein
LSGNVPLCCVDGGHAHAGCVCDCSRLQQQTWNPAPVARSSSSATFVPTSPPTHQLLLLLLRSGTGNVRRLPPDRVRAPSACAPCPADFWKELARDVVGGPWAGRGGRGCACCCQQYVVTASSHALLLRWHAVMHGLSSPTPSLQSMLTAVRRHVVAKPPGT